jgi:uncharacterized protein (DUF1697 family)
MRQIGLLRGINLGPRNRIPMPALRDCLASDGLQDVKTYVQSGNVVVTSDETPEELARRCEALIASTFGLDIPVIARTRDELAEVVRLNPLREVADNPKRYQVTFLSAEPEHDQLERLAALAAPAEELVAVGREIYSWHPAGVGRSKLWGRIAGTGLGVTATARNWTTVEALLQIADD